MKFLAAAVQMLASSDKAANLDEARRWIRAAASKGARVVALPEVFIWRGNKGEEITAAERIPGPTSQELAGIAPVTEKSGQGIWIHWRLACSKFLKQTFQEFAGCSIVQSDWARACYDQLRTRGKSHHAALRALAFKWIRIMFRCWKDRKPYDEATYLNSLKIRRSPLADDLPAA